MLHKKHKQQNVTISEIQHHAEMFNNRINSTELMPKKQVIIIIRLITILV